MSKLGQPDPVRTWPFYSPAALARLRRLAEEGDVFAIGVHPAITALEERFSEVHGGVAHALFCGSGSAALLSAYFGLDFDPGAEVLVPTNTYPTTVTPLLLLNLQPVLCDADPITGNLDLCDADRRVTERTQAITVTHMWGHPLDLAAVQAFAERHGLAVVEDCSHAHGATSNGIPVGSIADASAFSLGARKLASGGSGGMLLTPHASVYERALILGQPSGRAARQVGPALAPYAMAGLGLNLRGTPTAAVLAHDHLDRLPVTIEVKNRNLELLGEALASAAPWLEPPRRMPWFSSGTWYGFRCAAAVAGPALDDLVARLRERDVPVARTAIMLHRQRVFQDPSPLRTQFRGRAPLCELGDFPVGDAIAERTVAIGTERLYEPADDLVARWHDAFRAVTAAGVG